MTDIAKPKTPSNADFAKLLNTRQLQLYELTPTNALPTVAAVADGKRPGKRYYLFVGS